MEEEIWDSIHGWEGYYQVSSLGKIKSMGRTIINSLGRKCPIREQLLKPSLDLEGYEIISPCRNNEKTMMLVHRLVAMAFIPKIQGKPDVNHLNKIKTDNRAVNLEWCTPRENSTYIHLSNETSSKYTGVSWYKDRGKWGANIGIGNKRYSLGYFNLEEDAAKAYHKALIDNRLINKYAIPLTK